MSKKTVGQRGFTIVELLIVIVVIAVLATLPVAAYSGMQQRGRDTQRVSDMKAIVKGLEMYKTLNGSYPANSTTNIIPGTGWEASSVNPSQFLSSLRTTSVMSAIPVDPVNNGNTSTSGFAYRYHRFSPGENGCDITRGGYYVLITGKAETVTSQLSSSPGFQCSGHNWSAEGGWVIGAFVN